MANETSAGRARQLLLFGRRGERRGNGERSELGGELSRVEASASGGPVARAELEVSAFGPVAEDAEEIAQVGLRVETVKAGRSDQREEMAGAHGVVVAADKEPGFATDGDAAQLALAAVV